ncbi:MAG: hypothetical protein P4L66_10255 [Acetobacteraceae bacterium]|nr:hypothetical protein [Acetobacteraceae bacterium]
MMSICTKLKSLRPLAWLLPAAVAACVPPPDAPRPGLVAVPPPQAAPPPVPAELAPVYDRIDACWHGVHDMRETGADLRFTLKVLYDPSGRVADIQVFSPDQGQIDAEPRLQTVIAEGRRAVMAAHCNPMPMPTSVAGRKVSATFVFVP